MSATDDLIKIKDNRIQTLESEIVRLVEALQFIGHECLHSDETCPTRYGMRVKAKRTLAECPIAVGLAERKEKL